jgi:hypothetical protein
MVLVTPRTVDMLYHVLQDASKTAAAYMEEAIQKLVDDNEGARSCRSK